MRDEETTEGTLSFFCFIPHPSSLIPALPRPFDGRLDEVGLGVGVSPPVRAVPGGELAFQTFVLGGGLRAGAQVIAEEEVLFPERARTLDHVQVVRARAA